MSLLSVVSSVCATVGVQVPTSVFSGITGNRTMTEMLDLANEMARRIAYDQRDWTKFRTTVTYPGDGVTTAFDLPANYKRMLLNSNVWRSTSTMAPMRFVPDTDEWLQRRARGYNDAWGEWMMMGGKINIFPAMGSDVSAYFAYLDKNCIDLTSGGRGDTFMADSDGFALDERLLRLGMIWQWKAEKGSPYNEDLGTFEDAMSYAMGHDSPAPIIIGRTPISVARGAYPYPAYTVPL